MVNPNDATIDIPLAKVETKTGARRTSWEKHQHPAAEQQINEKAGFYQRQVAGRRKAAKKTGHKGADGEEDTLNRMGMIYKKILDFSVVTRYFLYVLPVAGLISIPIIIGATAAQNATMGGLMGIEVGGSMPAVDLPVFMWNSQLRNKEIRLGD
ncbi:MAG: hypothetical protein Q9164_006068 [Protoblastenia rupestris]